MPSKDNASYETNRCESTETVRPRQSPLPENIGPYKILEKIGEGGMGTVYVAEQRTPIRRRVALKVIKLGMDTKQVLARFEVEHHALAIMNHPNIARVFDAGATSEGRPYFVMEHVQGIPINDYCDRNRLTNRQRLDLFVQVCNGVQHAHQKGVIHRDLKPSNILIIMQDGKPVPKIIDFGVAKATAHQLTERTLYTELGQLVGTPEYMSPEQAEMTAIDIDTRSDVYSLGVILYELLVGALPFDPKTLRRAGYAEIQRIIREVDPPKPSTRLSTLEPGDSTAAAQHRKTDVRALSRHLRGDLDWIILKALEKDRTRRYETAIGLAADIDRHIQDEPVDAGPPSAGYRLKKLVRRNRGSVVAILAVVISLTVGLGFSISFYLQADDERGKATIAAARSQLEARKAEKITGFLQRMLSSADPARAKGRDVTVRELLDVAGQELETELSGQPEARAAVHETIARTYYNLGIFDRAVPHIQRVVDYRRRTLGEEHTSTLQGLWWLANSYFFTNWASDDAVNILRPLLTRATMQLGESHTLTIGVMSHLGDALRSQGKHQEAEPFLKESLLLAQKHFGDEDVGTARAMVCLGLYLWETGQHSQGNELFENALAINRKIRGRDNVWTLENANELARAYLEQERLQEAKTLIDDTLPRCRRHLGDHHFQTLKTIACKARLLQMDGQQEESVELARLALAGFQELGQNYRSAWWIGTLARLFETQGFYEEAQAAVLEALSIERRVLGDGHARTLESLGLLGRLATAAGDLEKAHEYTRQWLSGLRRATELPDAEALVWNTYAWALLTCEPTDLRDPATALPVAQKAVEQSGGTNLASLDTLALAQQMTGDIDGAVETERTALALLSPGLSSVRTEIETNLAKYLFEQKSYAQVEPLVLELHQQLEDNPESLAKQKQESIELITKLYEAWHAAEPGKDYASKAAEWRAKLPVENGE